MNRWTVLVLAMAFGVFALMGCSGGDGSPVAPTADIGITAPTSHAGQSQTHLWGYWDVFIDVETQTVEAIPNRDAAFAANVVQFLNNNPAGLAFNIIATPIGPTYIDVTIDVSITHPLPGMTQYNGYDVRGIFVGDGSDALQYGTGLRAAALGVDQYCFNADGYTRWWNPGEFPIPGLMGYTPGAVASAGFTGTARLNPYRYYANGLGPTADLWGFLGTTANNGVFNSGATNTRRYELRFPNSKGVQYGYAVVANWQGELPADHPSNAPECTGAEIVITDDIYYVGPGDSGGDLILDLSLFNWGDQPNVIVVESDLIGGEYTLSPAEMIPTGGTGKASTYHVEIPTTTVPSQADSSYWVIAEAQGENYVSTQTPPGGAPAATLAAFFRGVIEVAPIAFNKPPDINSGVDGNAEPIVGALETYNVDAVDPDGDPITYTWTLEDDVGDPVTGYDGVPGDGAGNLDVDFGALGSLAGAEFVLGCVVEDDQGNPPVNATPLDIRVWVDGQIWVSNNPDFAALPENGTKTEPFHTITAAIYSGYIAYDTIVVDYGVYVEQIYLNYAQPVTIWGWNWYTDTGTRPVVQLGYAYPCWINYTNYVVIRGFKFTYGLGANTNYLMRVYWSHNCEITDNWFTGETGNNFPYAIYCYYSDNVKVTNNEISDFGTTGVSYAYPYAMYIYRGYGTGSEISRNLITEIQPSGSTNYMYPYVIMSYYLPGGSQINNNLVHHIDPTPGSGQSMYLRTFYIYYPYSTVEIAHNTVDYISLENCTYPYASSYGMYIYDYSSYHANTHSNIVTRFYKNFSNQYTYGMYCYDMSNYCDVWDFPMGGYRYMNAPEGPNSINADPLYVECDTEPYDYTLDTGSPCIGTGFSGNDMGCYGNLAAGQTVGLLTPK